MQEILLMCFGIFIFVLGQKFDELTEAMKKQHKQTYKDECAEIEDETYDEEYADKLHMRCNTLERAVEDLNTVTTQTYTDIPKTSPAPPQAYSEGYVEDWIPTLHEEEEVDVEIMTTEREQMLYNRAKLGGVR